MGREDLVEMKWQQVFLPGEIPWTEKPGGLQSMGSQRVRHNGVHTKEDILKLIVMIVAQL